MKWAALHLIFKFMYLSCNLYLIGVVYKCPRVKMVKFSLKPKHQLEVLQHRFKYIWNVSPLAYCFQNLTKKFVIWLAIFVPICLFACLPFRTAAYALLALKLSQIAIPVIWHFMPKEFISNLDEKAIFITGCDTGFGNKLARKLDKKGLTVYAGCLFPDGDGAKDLKNSCSSRLRIVQLDVTNDEHVQNAAKMVKSTLGNKKLWAVVNNAGIGVGGEVEWTPVEICRKTLEVNAVGPYRVTQAFLPLLRKSQGRIVVVVSVLGRTASPGMSSYCMSKYAAAAFADALRRELIKWNVSVHTIEPWLYSTNLTDPGQVCDDLHKNWNTASEEMKTEYGKDYYAEFEKATLLALTNTKRSESKTYEVVDALEHAAIGKDPKIRYVPGLIGHAWTWISCALPAELLDILGYFLIPRIQK